MQHAPIAAPAVGASPCVSLPIPIGLAALAGFAFNNVDLAGLHAHFTARCAVAANPSLLIDLSILEAILGNAGAARQAQARALLGCRLFHRLSVGPSGPRLLAVLASGGLMANTPLEFLLDGSDAKLQNIRLQMVYCRPGEALPSALPPHDVLFVAIGESDEHRETLEVLARQLSDWPVPVLNRPEAIALLGRQDVANMLRGRPGILAPRVIRTRRENFLESVGSFAGAPIPGGQMRPVLARPTHSHAGKDLRLLTTPVEAAGYVAAHGEPEFYLSEYVDYRNADGKFRKYRVAFVDGVAYPVHMAIATHWMIHYLNAGMSHNAAKRDEEAQWMAAFDAQFAPRHRAAFATLVECVGLDYFVIDCGETRTGELLIFELDSAMLVHAMDHPVLFAYKQAPMHRLFQAVQAMIRKYSGKNANLVESAGAEPITTSPPAKATGAGQQCSNGFHRASSMPCKPSVAEFQPMAGLPVPCGTIVPGPCG